MFGRHPRIRLAMVCEKQRLGGVLQFYKLKSGFPKYFGTALNLSSMEDNKNTFTHSLTKATTSQITFTSVLKMKSSSTCLISASLCEGPFFYFYVDSPPRIRTPSGIQLEAIDNCSNRSSTVVFSLVATAHL